MQDSGNITSIISGYSAGAKKDCDFITLQPAGQKKSQAIYFT
jgi:hypothetical protein